MVIARDSLFAGNVSANSGGAVSLNDGGSGSRFTNSAFSDNVTGGYGGALETSTGIQMTDTTFARNVAGVSGGVLRSQSPDLIGMVRVTMTVNAAQSGNGGALLLQVAAPVSIVDSVFVSNTALAGEGGAIWAIDSVPLVRARLEGNRAWRGGALSVNSTDILSSTAQRNRAFEGGVLVTNGSGAITFRNSTVNDNETYRGGVAILSEDGFSMINSTASGNRARGDGGVLSASDSAATVNLSNATVSANVADSDADGYGDGGALNTGTLNDQVFLRNSILSANTDNSPATKFNDCIGPLTSADYNLFAVTPGCAIGGVTAHDRTGDPLLGALANNGGPTLTRMPQPTSLAIDGGNAAGCRDQANNLLTTDQRGSVRPIDGDGLGGTVCDIGAVEAPAGLRVFVPKTMRGE